MPENGLFKPEDQDRPETLPATVEPQEGALERVSGPSAMQVLAQMGRDKASADAMAVVADLVWKQEDREAERELARDFAAFQRECPEIKKTKEVEVATRSGSSYSYFFEPLDRIERVVKPLLLKHRISYSWDSEPIDGRMVVTCILTHENGHSRKATFINAMASGSPTMSESQKHASSMTYAKRQSLIAALGISTAESDLDGADAGMQDYVTAEQAAELRDLATEAGADVAKFFAWVGADEWEYIRAGQYEPARAMLLRKLGR